MIAWLAVCIDTTDVRQATDILALPVDAGFLIGTVVVMTTALYAAIVVADEPMKTLIVPRAFRLWLISETDHVGIATMTRKAGAVGMVVDRTAQGIAAAGSIDTTRVLTDAIYASFVTGAPLIGSAAIDTLVAFTDMAKSAVSVGMALLSWFHWNWSALNLWIAKEAPLTRTDRTVSSNDTECIDATGSGNMADVLTLAVVAGLAGKALVIRATAVDTTPILADLSEGALTVSLATFFSQFSTVDLGISRQSWQAQANRAVVRSAAVGIASTDTREAAGVLTAVADASLVIGTGIIGATGIDARSLLADAANRTVAVMVAEFLP